MTLQTTTILYSGSSNGCNPLSGLYRRPACNFSDNDLHAERPRRSSMESRPSPLNLARTGERTTRGGGSGARVRRLLWLSLAVAGRELWKKLSTVVSTERVTRRSCHCGYGACLGPPAAEATPADRWSSAKGELPGVEHRGLPGACEDDDGPRDEAAAPLSDGAPLDTSEDDGSLPGGLLGVGSPVGATGRCNGRGWMPLGGSEAHQPAIGGGAADP